MITLMVVMGLFGLNNQEYLDKVEEQVDKGYTWEYRVTLLGARRSLSLSL